jgi:acetylornithine deacetylase/succinyl-diaminopimelate desuccinylase-like protein
VDFVLNEGGAIIEPAPGQVMYGVELAQKAPLWLRLTARGTSGHASAPTPDTATAVLVRALARLAEHRFPIVVVPEVQAMFAARAARLPEAERAPFRDLALSLKNPKFQSKFLQNPRDAALVRSTLAITQLSGSDKENVISEQASAVIDMRLLPGQDATRMTEELKRIMAEPSIELTALLSWTAQASPRDTPLFAAIERLARARHPGAPVMANVIGGFTDCNAFRTAKPPVLWLSSDADQIGRSARGSRERRAHRYDGARGVRARAHRPFPRSVAEAPAPAAR